MDQIKIDSRRIALLRLDGTIIEVNKTALEIGRLTLGEVKDQKFWNAYWWHIIPHMQQELQAAIKRSAEGELVRYEMPAYDTEGNRVIIDLSFKPIRDRKGTVILLVAEGRNITDLHFPEEHLRLTEPSPRQTQHLGHTGHWEYSFSNAQAIFSDSLREIFGLSPDVEAATAEVFMSRIHPEDLEEVQAALYRSYQTGLPFEMNFRIIRPDGAVRIIYTTGKTIYDESGNQARMAGVIHDISGQRKLEDSLSHSTERLSGLKTIGQTVTRSMDLGFMNETVLSIGRQMLRAEAMLLFSHEDHELIITAADQDGALQFSGRRIAEDAGVAGLCWTTGKSVWLRGDGCRERRSAWLVSMTGHSPASIIAVPIRWQNRLLGILEATHTREDAFEAKDIGILEAVANWMSVIIGKVSQHETMQRRLRESEIIAEVSDALSQTLEPQAILDMIVNKAYELVPRSDWAIIHLLMGRPERLEPAAIAGTEEDLSDYVIGADEGLAGVALKESKVLNVDDTQSDPRPSAFAHRSGLRSLLVVPIRSRSRLLGTLTLHCHETFAFKEEDEMLVTILAAQAGLAIENSQLFDSQRRARHVAELQRERMRALADQILTTQEEERSRISRELHDEAGQALTSLKIGLDLIREGLPPELETLRDRLADLAALTGNTMDAIRNLAHDLRPPGLDAFGLNVALDGLCHDYSTRADMNIYYQGVELPEIPTTVALAMYRFVQEALTNASKHAEASRIDVRLSLLDEAIELAVIDDGEGFIYDADSRNRVGIGLASMQERIDLIGGTLEINTAPGAGTILIARVPRRHFVIG